jgi:hypothetical protein
MSDIHAEIYYWYHTVSLAFGNIIPVLKKKEVNMFAIKELVIAIRISISFV